MPATQIARAATVPAQHRPVERAGLHAVSAAAADLSAQAAAELRRWTVFLTIPFVLSAICFAAAIGTGRLWLIGGALVTGPGLLIMAFVYLGLSSDANDGR
jgi:hypothetical protein